MCVSKNISQQIVKIAGGKPPLTLEFLPTYRRTEFNRILPPDHSRSPFVVLFIGRIEVDKGVFDLLEIAKKFANVGRTDIRFDLCGTGSALDALKLAVNEAGLANSFICYGHCNKSEMHAIFSQAHIIIAPTKISFFEGFCKSIAEGILAGRPIVTSSVCPALSYVNAAVVEVPPNDHQAYADAILQLKEDAVFYQEKAEKCAEVQEQFYDQSRSWGAVLKQILMDVLSAAPDREFDQKCLHIKANDESIYLATPANRYHPVTTRPESATLGRTVGHDASS